MDLLVCLVGFGLPVGLYVYWVTKQNKALLMGLSEVSQYFTLLIAVV
jgi:hypothetical protein